jgi:hypothetical protein
VAVAARMKASSLLLIKSLVSQGRSLTLTLDKEVASVLHYPQVCQACLTEVIQLKLMRNKSRAGNFMKRT